MYLARGPVTWAKLDKSSCQQSLLANVLQPAMAGPVMRQQGMG
jgi:hypothetical protein